MHSYATIARLEHSQAELVSVVGLRVVLVLMWTVILATFAYFDGQVLIGWQVDHLELAIVERICRLELGLTLGR